MLANRIYYLLKPVIPRSIQLALRSQTIRIRRSCHSDIWPIDPAAAKLPEHWQGWPNGKQFAVILTHDVDTLAGQNKCRKLMELEKKLGFRSSFNFVPERYSVSSALRNELMESGFEVGVHGLIHDGKLYSSEKVFFERAQKINNYIREWKAVGFRSPSMHHNLEWIHQLDIEYDASTFDTDPFEPQSDGLRTIFPQWVENSNGHGYVELPYTLAQDFTLFILMREKNIAIWKQKLDWVVENGGMVLLNTHPDYMAFEPNKQKQEEYPIDLYLAFLKYLKNTYHNSYWHVLPREMACFWKSFSFQ